MRSRALTGTLTTRVRIWRRSRATVPPPALSALSTSAVLAEARNLTRRGVVGPPSTSAGALVAVAVLVGVVAYNYLKPALAASEPVRAVALTPAASAATTYTIDQASSTASFTIDEVLNGSPNTVVGTTNQVAGEIAIDPNNPSKARVGTIQVDARTLATDSGMRNRTIANRILLTNQYEYITFTPTRLVGLPQQATIGQSYTFQIVGNLKIRDVTKEVTFNVSAKAPSKTQLQATAKTTIRYADFGITIPQVPQVASVGDQVQLELDFVAVPK